MTFCSSCGAQVPGQFCPQCGTKVGSAAPSSGAPVATSEPISIPENVAAALCYLVVIGIIFLIVEPYNRSKTIRFHAFQALFFFFALAIVWIACGVLVMMLHLIPVIGPLLGRAILSIVWLGGLGGWLFLMYKAYMNERFVIPVIGPLAEKQA
jgi:uncharacterized membrane protein